MIVLTCPLQRELHRSRGQVQPLGHPGRRPRAHHHVLALLMVAALLASRPLVSGCISVLFPTRSHVPPGRAGLGVLRPKARRLGPCTAVELRPSPRS